VNRVPGNCNVPVGTSHVVVAVARVRDARNHGSRVATESQSLKGKRRSILQLLLIISLSLSLYTPILLFLSPPLSLSLFNPGLTYD
jgi:hypothetical protein